MPKVHEENERIKRRYLTYLREAKGQDEKSLDKAAAAIRRFEESTGVKPFKVFHIEQAQRFKAKLAKEKSRRTGKPLSLTTVDATLRQVKAFILWLAGQPGYRSRISYADAEYFNNTMKNARAAHASRPAQCPSMAMCSAAFAAMPEETVIGLRDKALFALFMLTGVRVGAAASLRLKHLNLSERHLFQDGREVNTKNGKTIDTWFFPVGEEYVEVLTRWITHLQERLLFGPEDPLFPKQKVLNQGGIFTSAGFERLPYASTAKLNGIVKKAFAAAELPKFTPHAFRSTLAMYGDETCDRLDEKKAWSMNLGHENLATTISSYMPVSKERQKEILQKLLQPSATVDPLP